MLKKHEALDVIPGIFEDRDKKIADINRRREAAIWRVEAQLEEKSPFLYRSTTLFKLKLDDPTISDDTTLIHGVFTLADIKRHRFLFYRTYGADLVTSYICTELLDEGFAVLFDYFRKKGLVIVLRGKVCADCGNKTFCVESVQSSELDRSGDACLDVSNIILQSIVARLVAVHAPECILEAYKSCQLPASQSELELLYTVLKNKLIAEHCMFVEQSFMKLISNNVPISDRTERGQILKAISYVLNIDWTVRVRKLPSSAEIKNRLDEQFYGLEEVKRRVQENVALMRRKGKATPILLSGPPGVGKTSIAKVIAKIFNLPVNVLDFSSNSDEESLAGTSRVYSNAKPGLILDKLYENRSGSCVFLLNELDKVGQNNKEGQGTATDVLLSLLDGQGFHDNYIEAAVYPNSIFIATCNDPDLISNAILDRFTQIEIPGYTQADKQKIFQNYVFPKACTGANIRDEELIVSDDFVRELCQNYTTKAGIRDLEQAAERIVGDFLLHCEKEGIIEKRYTTEDLASLFGTKKSSVKRFVQTRPGQAQAVFVPKEGNATLLLVQATARAGTGQIKLIGVSTEFYRDCCRAAYESVRNCYSGANFEKLDITIYLSEQIVPSSQNFLGCAVFMAILSALTNQVIPETAVFLGGCDLLGNTYYDSTNIDPVIELMERLNGVDHTKLTLYGPMNVSDLTTRNHTINLVGSFSVEVLFAML